jgi:hypothetical protein
MFHLSCRKGKIVVKFSNPTKKNQTLSGYFLKSCCNFNTRNPTLTTITYMHLTNAILMRAMDCGVVKKMDNTSCL